MDCRPPGSSVPGSLQARILDWVAIFSSRGSSCVQVDGPQDFNIFSENSNDPAFANSGLRYLGGRGEFDPGFAAYNREIDVSGFHDVEVSVWYSAEDTEDVDDFALYYKDGSSWQPIKVVPKTEHDLGGGQLSWTNVVKQIPDGINPLIIQFRWSTSHDGEHMMIDDLQVSAIPN